MRDCPNPKYMSEDELMDNLITLDYRGKEFKKLCLDELIGRKIKSNKEVE